LQNEKLWFKTRNFGFQKHEVSVLKPKVSVQKPEVSVENPEVLDTIFGLETFVKVVFRNASVAETRKFQLLCGQIFVTKKAPYGRILIGNSKIQLNQLLIILQSGMCS
jgi:hypothetical protein